MEPILRAAALPSSLAALGGCVLVTYCLRLVLKPGWTTAPLGSFRKRLTPTESQPLGVGPRRQCGLKLPGWFLCAFGVQTCFSILVSLQIPAQMWQHRLQKFLSVFKMTPWKWVYGWPGKSWGLLETSLVMANIGRNHQFNWLSESQTSIFWARGLCWDTRRSGRVGTASIWGWTVTVLVLGKLFTSLDLNSLF